MCLRRGRSGWLAVLASRKLCAGVRRGLPKKGEPALLERGDPSERPGPAATTRCAGKLAFLGPAALAAVRRTAPWPLAARGPCRDQVPSNEGLVDRQTEGMAASRNSSRRPIPAVEPRAMKYPARGQQ